MTSKEALSDLFFLAIGDEKHTKKCKETIEKDLEVLKIFKNNEISISYIERSKSYDDYIEKCDYFRCLSYITEKEFNLLKEWLENE